MAYYYVYVLWSEKDGMFYTGYSKDLDKRLNEHNNSQVPSTKLRTPFLIYWLGCLNRRDDTRRENYLK